MVGFTGNISGTASTATNAQGLIGSPSISVTNITIGGELIDGDGNFGTSGQILSSDAIGDDKWITSGDLTAGATALVQHLISHLRIMFQLSTMRSI